ncbi:MAG: hypothetical protein KKA79_03140 [Nanoarchaeota archaeon]|nr:hypothetical protein [Nanoarchaeota archaeon]MCG2717653.1 hypothetical protein [Nanoarchaeota archaeon]
MKLPNTFRTEKDKIEDLIKKTLVDKVLTEDIGKEIRKYLDMKNISDNLYIEFWIVVDLSKHPNLELEKEKEFLRKKTFIKSGYDSQLYDLESDRIINMIYDLEPNIKAEEITNSMSSNVGIIRDDMVYRIKFTDVRYYDEDEVEVNTGKIWKEVFRNPTVFGKVEYVLFNKTHNEKLLRALEKEDYHIAVKVKEPQKK